MESTFVAAWKRNADRLTTRDRAIDAAIALLIFAFGVVILFSHGLGEPAPNTRDGDMLGVALLALACFPLAVRRVAPSLVLVLTVGAVVPIVLLRYPGEISNLPLLAVYTLAAAGDRDPLSARAAMALAAGTFVALAICFVIISPAGDSPVPELLAEAILWLAVWIAGDRTRLRRERIAELEERVQRAEREAERERQLAAAEERTRIARELHDSAGHAMNVILVEAGAARLLRDRDPDRSRAALETIEQVARSTIGEIDRLVRHLREYGRARDVPASPLPGLADIDTLAERQGAAGQIETRVEGKARRLPPEVDRAAYRILQEAILNAVKHGRGGAEVVVSYGPRALEVSVTNPMRPNGSRQAGGGHGIVGMRERASLLGGSLETESENGVFRVWALLPYEGEAE